MMDERLNEDLKWIHREESKLQEKINESRKRNDRSGAAAARRALVKLYVTYGEYFKTASEPNPQVAFHYLKKAVSLQKDHPIANYRLAHLYYRRGKYPEALVHFEKALAGSADEGLNESQEIITNMFMVNSSMIIAKQALAEIESLEVNPYLNLDNKLIGRYRPEMLGALGDMFETKYYRKISVEKEEIITDEALETILENRANPVTITFIDGCATLYLMHHEPLRLETTAFRVLYLLLRAERPLTSEDLIERLYYGVREDVSPIALRQAISRLQRRVPFWEKIFQSKTIEHPQTRRPRTARKRREGITFCVVCGIGDILPDE
ncbi:tetratricopeptide repeat protein [Bacillus rubiinfantis]|uniref:tetratricopeptide repeat protein n=1 Tax=Bacillus rubiinfantis TaxID=1499680 RepID=UPI0005A8A61A|nr:tetratricopeptide repeat protein [Bacillus rubiinfantis]